MSKNSELLDRAIAYMVTFPVTIVGLLFKPRTVLSAEYEDKRCPPGVAFVLSLTVWFIGNRTILRILVSKSDISLVPAGDEIARIIIGAAALLLVQALVLSALLRKRYPGRDWRILAQYLAYPVATYFLAVGLVTLLSIHFPDTTRMLSQTVARLECRFDSEIVDRARWLELNTATFPSQVRTVSHVLGFVVYLWALNNVIRANFGVSFFKSMGMTLMALAVAVAVFLAGVWMVDKTEQSVKELSQIQRQSSAGKGANQPNKTLQPTR